LKHLNFAAALLGAAALLSSLPAMAVYRCESKGKVTYQDTACPGGREIEAIETSPKDAEAARKRAAEERKLLKQIQSDQKREEASAARKSSAAVKVAAGKEKKCVSLARRKQYASEDAALARGKAIDKAKRTARRREEEYLQECRS
jgi:hypothetical protein